MQESSSSGPIEMPSGSGHSVFTNFKMLFQNGHSVLYQAQRYGRNFILKFMRSDCPYGMTELSFLGKEFALTLQLDHPNIVRVFSMERLEGRGTCIVMEYIDGVSLDQWLSASPSQEERKRVYLQLLDAVSHIHSHQIIHRDLKPSNILITRNGNNVKVIDFGFSDSDSYAILKQSAGTYKYMSPEQKNPNGVVDARSDIYSLGLLLKEIFPTKYGKVAAKCLMEDPQDRYSNVHQLRSDFLSSSKSLFFVGGGIVLFLLCVALGYWWSVKPTIEKGNNSVAPKDTAVSVQSNDVIIRDTIVRRDTIVVQDTKVRRDTIVLHDGEIHSEQDKTTLKDKVALVEKEAAQRCEEIRKEYERIMKESKYVEFYTQEMANCHYYNVYEFYKRTVSSEWGKDEYATYYSVFEENYQCNLRMMKIKDSLQLPSLAELYGTPQYDSLNAILTKMRDDLPVDSMQELHSKFYKWSVAHIGF